MYYRRGKKEASNMQLFAAGFNAWRQLEFDAPKGAGFADGDNGEEPDDVGEFRLVLTDHSIDRPYASLAYTLGSYRVPRSGL